MEKRLAIQDIIFLPSNFCSRMNVSSFDLLKETCYFELYHQISEQDIREGLGQHVECLDEWIKWSDNKRSGTGWFLKMTEDGAYVVGYFPSSESLKPKKYFLKLDACAAYIKREIEDIRTN